MIELSVISSRSDAYGGGRDQGRRNQLKSESDIYHETKMTSTLQTEGNMVMYDGDDING
jgi:hypothetical protein